MSTFTPGPWSVCEHSWSRTGIYSERRSIATLDIESEADEETQAEWEATMAANARLISAAPELLDCCNRALAAWEGSGPSIVLDDLRAVIAKATGAA